ncbi:hypothetical protein J6Z39_02255 [bacterium]|nr:hypothetical protein [bacterium]MBR6244260.1 hypothetical protein [bacterium]
MKKVFLLLVFLLCALQISAKESVQAAVLHNDGYTLYKEFHPNDNNYKNTIRDMEVLATKHKSKVFSQSAALIKTIRSKCKYYYDTNTKLIELLKQKWNKPHYMNMDEEWKTTTFAKDRKKVTDLHMLSLGMQQAFNDWNEARNQAVKMTKNEDIIKAVNEANERLKATIDSVLAEEKPAFDAISKELEVIKLKK